MTTVKEKVKSESKTEWFDKFRCLIEKKQVLNRIANRPETIIVGWRLTEKLHPVKIESSIATYFNSFVDGCMPHEPGMLYFPAGTHSIADFIPYKQWADEQGKDPETDINLIFSSSKARQ
jgi:hypothetical protein